MLGYGETVPSEVLARFSSCHESIRTETGSPARVPLSWLMERWMIGERHDKDYGDDGLFCFLATLAPPLLPILTHLLSLSSS